MSELKKKSHQRLESTVLSQGRSQLKRQNLRVGGYTENSLKWFNYPHQGPTLDAMGLNWFASSVRQLFVEDSPTVEKAASCYKADRLVTPLLSFRSIQSSLAVHEFHAAGEEPANEATDGCVCEPLMPDVVSLSGPTYLWITTREFSMVGGYTESLEKPQNCQNRGVGACTGMGTCSGQYSSHQLLSLIVQ